MKKIQVYSAITDNFDSEISDDRIIFKDYSKFKNPRLNAKIYKALPHLFLSSESSLWIDGNVQLNCDPEELFEIMGDKEILVFKNPNGDCLYEEADRCLESSLDDPSLIKSQVSRYKDSNYQPNSGLGACRLILRKHTSTINNLNSKWWSEICTGSYRDEISFPYVYGDNVQYIDHPKSYNNDFFTVLPHNITFIQKIRFKLTGSFR
tara:strand:- start:3856 stop:4476 length:621 start_codon:yes stop_codon:yes gene_type:complete